MKRDMVRRLERAVRTLQVKEDAARAVYFRAEDAFRASGGDDASQDYYDAADSVLTAAFNARRAAEREVQRATLAAESRAGDAFWERYYGGDTGDSP